MYGRAFQRLARFGVGAVALAFALPVSAQDAQSPSQFQLPESKPSATTRAQGPVDPDNPVIETRPSPKPSAATPPAETASPRITLPAGNPNAPRLRPAPAPAKTPTAAEVASAPAPSAEPLAPETVAPTPLPPSPLPAPTEIATAAPAKPNELPWIWIGVAALSAAILGAIALWRRRKVSELVPVAEIEPERATAPPPTPTPRPPAPRPAPPPQRESDVALTFEATRLSATMLFATLSYRLEVANTGSAAIGPFSIRGDMISAHASLPAEQQVARANAALELRHELPGLAPGEKVVLNGEIRLPLTEIVPIKQGNSALFVPLARFRLNAAAPPVVHCRTFVIGQLPPPGAQALLPFRLDEGPRNYSEIGQRELAVTA